MRVSSWTEYSLIIVLHLARRHRGGQVPVAAREIAEVERLPAHYVEQILLRLRRAALVESVRGARGGYRLARDAADISVRDVMSASEHQLFDLNCDTHQIDPVRCSPQAGCSIRPVWVELQRQIDGLLAGITLASLLEREPAAADLALLHATT